MSLIKTKEEIKIMRKAGHLLFDILKKTEGYVHEGISTYELDKIIHDKIVGIGCKPAFLGYSGFPNTACISLNDEVVHGIPKKERKIKKGDILKIDLGLIYENYYSDMARSYLVDSDDPDGQKLIDVTHECCMIGGRNAKAGVKLGTLGYEIEKYAESHGYSVVMDYVGHGIGRNLHEEPQVPNFGIPNQGFILEENMVICIEPMVNEGTFKVNTLADGWTVVTRDHKRSAHWENMFLVTKTGGERLTA